MSEYRRRPQPVCAERGASLGFTLIEIMIVVVIIGILAAIAVPQYSEYSRKARRSAAQALMSSIAAKQNQHLLSQRVFTSSLSDLGLEIPANVDDHYALVIEPDNAAVPPTFTVTATPAGDQSNDTCGVLTIDEMGNKSASKDGTDVAGCW